jgi:glycosyltransferase involved in cell wall biosynthesis
MGGRDNQHRRPLSVLVVGQGFPTFGGIPTFIDTLMKDRYLRERVRLEFFNTTPEGDKRPGAFHFSNIASTISDAIALFKRGRGKDVVHLNLAPAPLLPLLRAGALCAAARAAGTRVILHAHSGRLERCMNNRPYRWVMRAVLSLVDSCIVVSRAAEAALGRISSKTAYIPNGIDIAGVVPAPKSQPPVLVFVGTVCERKGLLDLRDALLQLQRNGSNSSDTLQAVIVGDAKQEGPGVFERIREAFYEFRLTNVEFRGPLDRTEILRLLARASIFCLPSHWEGLPLSLLEAMAAGTAAVATRVGEVPTMLDHGRSGFLVEPGDVAGLAGAIEELVRDAGLRERLGHAARKRAETAYGYDKTVTQIYNLYKSVVYSR